MHLVVAQVDAVDADSAHTRVVEPWNQADQTGFPAAGVSDDADELARCDFERDIAKNGFFAVVAEGHALEAQRTLQPLGLGGVGLLLDAGLGIEQRTDPLHADGGHGDRVRQLRKVLNGFEE